MRRGLAGLLVAFLGIGLAAPAAHAGGATSAALGLASFAVFNQLFGPLFYPRVAYAAPYYAFGPPVVTRSVIYYQAPPAVHYYSYPPPSYAYPAAHAYTPPPAGPTTPSTVAPTGGVIYYPHGRYELRGNGVTERYAWVWIPNPPPPPGPPAPPMTAPPAS